MFIVCPSVPSTEMAMEVLHRAQRCVKLLADVSASEQLDPYLENELIRGWDEAELKDPILRDLFPRLYFESDFFLIYDFGLDGSVRKITPMSRRLLYQEK